MRHPKLRPPRNVLILFMAAAVVLVSALVWMSWRLLAQERALEDQRIQERLENAADLIVTSLDLGLSEIENRLSLLSDPGDHALSVAFGPREVKTHPGGLEEHKKRLEKEGHKLIARGKKYQVADFL